MRIATLNLGHQVLVPKQVPEDLLNALTELDADVLFLTEIVQSPAYLDALHARWPSVVASAQVQHSRSRSRFANQVMAVSRHACAHLPGGQVVYVLGQRCGSPRW